MVIRLTCLAALVVALCLASVAEARPKSEADDKALAALLAQADAASAILEAQVERPDKAIKQLDRFWKKKRKKMKALVAQLATAAGELDDDAKSDLRTSILFSDQVGRFLKALGAFQDRWGEDPKYGPKIQKRLDQLEADAKPLTDVLLK